MRAADFASRRASRRIAEASLWRLPSLYELISVNPPLPPEYPEPPLPFGPFPE